MHTGQDQIHQPLERCRDIGKPKLHGLELKKNHQLRKQFSHGFGPLRSA